MDKKLLYFVRSLFLNFSNSSKERSFTPSLRLLCLGMFFVVNFGFSQNTWVGGDGNNNGQRTNWNRPLNWSANRVPLNTDNVLIPDVTHNPVISSTGAVCANMTINSGGVLTVSEALTVGGTTSISGNLIIGSTAGTKRFDGLVTVNSGGNWTNNIDANINFRGGITNNGTFTAGTGTYTFNTNAQAISGTLTIPNIIVTGVTVTNNGILTASSALSGTGATTSLVNLGTLNIGGSSAITTLNATAIGNTVNYTGTSTQTVKTTDYYNLGSSGGGTKTVGGNITVNKNFSLVGGTFVLNNNTNSTLNILGDYNQTGGVFDFNAGTSGTSTLNLKGNFTNTAGVNSFTTVGVVKNGILNFTGTGTQTLSMPTVGAGTFVKYFVAAASTLKIVSDFTLSTALVSDTDPWMGELNVSGTVDLGLFKVYSSGGRGSSGTAKFVLNSGATFITANSGGVDGSVPVSADMVRTLNSGANYTFNGTVAQITSTGMPANVNNLTISNTHTSGVTLSNTTIVNEIFAVTAGSIANLGTSLIHNTSTLTLGGAVMIPGSWGSTGSTALNTNNIFFVASASGIINNTCTSPEITAHPQPLTICEGAGGTFSVTSSTSGVSYQWQYSSDLTNWFNVDAALGTSVTGYTTNTLSLNNTPVGWNGYRFRCVVRNNLCAANSSSAVLTVNFLPTVKTVAVESLTVCSGSGTNVTVSASQTGVSYQLRNASNIAIGSVVAGNGGTINLATGNLSATMTFNVLATNSSSASCSLQMGNTVTVTANTNDLGSQVGTTSTFCTDNLTTYTTPVATPGQFALVNVIKGFKYNFSVGDAFSAGSEVLTILDASSNANVSPAATNNGATGTAITDWVSSISGQIKVVLTTLNCAVNNTVAGTSGITVTQTAIGNNLDIQTTAGANNTWVGHIYNAGGARPTPFNSTNYAGYYTIGTTNFNENFGANNACIPVFSNGTQRASMYAEGFAVRYRMTYTNTPGCYLVKITGDDGVRLSIDGGSNYIFNFWDEQGATTYDYIVVNLSGTTNFVLDYYENGGENRVSFDIIPFNPALNIITAPTTINFCNGGDPAVIGGSMQYTSADVNQANPYINFQWQLSTNGGVSFNNIPSATTRTYDPPAYAANGGATDLVYQYKRLATVNTINVSGATCAFSESNIVTITHRPNASIASVTGANTLCISGTETYAANNVVLGGGIGTWSSSSPLVASVDASGNVTGLTAGTTNIVYTITGGCTGTKSAQQLLTVNTLPTIPDITITPPTCAAPTGTITVTSPVPGPGIRYSIGGGDYSNDTGVFLNVAPNTYYVTTQNASGCISPAKTAIVDSSSDRVWNGSIDRDWTDPANWTPAIVPGNTDCVVIPLTAKKPEIAAGTSVEIHSITVDNGALLTVKSKAILTVNAGITVDTGGNLVFEDDSSLLQGTDDAVNTGNITYKRITSDVRRYDFTCWSSPIHRTPFFTLHDVSPLTLADKYYSFNPSTGWKISYNGILPMEKGMGYIVRAPQHYDIVTPAPYEASFIGIPNNGTIDIVAEANKNILVGNPYPSALNAKKFIDDNHARGVDVGALYFWTHNSPPVNSIPGDRKYYYNTADYAVFNLSGSTESFSGANSNRPSGYIAAAASFFIRPNRDDVRFTNSMREGIKNDQFYKTAKKNDEGKNRLWLNFANTEGAFKQALIGYIDGATDNLDYNYDAPTNSGNAYVDFYSINNTDKLTIQGRALPFNDADLVPLGYVSKIIGDFTISIDEADGLFDTQAVYLEDKKTGKVTDLRAENYTFATEKGTFEDRFVLRYTNKTLGTGDFENLENGLLISVKDKTIKIISAKEAIKEVTIFDINGKLLYDKKKVGSTELQISNLQAANQVLLIKVILENGFTTTKKIVFQ